VKLPAANGRGIKNVIKNCNKLFYFFVTAKKLKESKAGSETQSVEDEMNRSYKTKLDERAAEKFF
jgi:hypothetical protein